MGTPNIQVSRDSEQLRVVIGPSRSSARVKRWLGVVVIGLFFCLLNFLSHSQATTWSDRVLTFVIGTLAATATAGAAAWASFQLFGTEVLTVKLGQLEIEKKLWRYERREAFALKAIRNFSLSEHILRKNVSRQLYRRIAFWVAGRTVTTSRSLSRAEGDLIYGLLAPSMASSAALSPRVSNEPADEVPPW